MSFGLKNAPAIFFRVVVEAFKEFLHKFMEAYFDDWTVCSLLQNHIECLRLMLDKCGQCQISLNLNKCIFFSMTQAHPARHVHSQDLLCTRPEELKSLLIPYREFSSPTTILQKISLNDREIGLRDFANPMVACFRPHDSLKSDVNQR
jgi:hypothetical protein